MPVSHFYLLFILTHFYRSNKEMVEKISSQLPACQTVSEMEMASIATTDTPSGILAVCSIPEYSNAAQWGELALSGQYFRPREHGYVASNISLVWGPEYCFVPKIAWIFTIPKWFGVEWGRISI